MQVKRKQNMQGFSCKRCNVHARIKWKWENFKHAMVEIKCEITTDLPIGKGSKFRVFWMRHFISINLGQAWRKFPKWDTASWKLSEKFVPWCGVWGAREYHLVLFWSFRSHDTHHPVILPLRVEYNYSPWLHRNVATCPIDVVFLVVGDQATTIEHLIWKGDSSLFQGWLQSWSIQ